MKYSINDKGFISCEAETIRESISLLSMKEQKEKREEKDKKQGTHNMSEEMYKRTFKNSRKCKYCGKKFKGNAGLGRHMHFCEAKKSAVNTTIKAGSNEGWVYLNQ